MSFIIFEGVLFVTGIVAVAALFRWLVRDATPAGLRARQQDNRRRIEAAAELDCPAHGTNRPEDLVRLPDGSLVCPGCYQETFR